MELNWQKTLQYILKTSEYSQSIVSQYLQFLCFVIHLEKSTIIQSVTPS